jgi:hypothetical protein
MSGVAQNIEEIYDSYVDLMVTGMFPPQTCVYDFTQTSPESVFSGLFTKPFEELEEIINEYLEERLRRSWS